MSDIKEKFGFGMMRLPLVDGKVDYEETSKMVDYFLEQGFNYFDTAHGYLNGQSEIAIRECLTKKYPRDRYVLTNKLTSNCFKTEDDIVPFFEKQLEICGVDYFDFYLMHAQGRTNYSHYQECHAYEKAFQLKKEGKIRHVGISFHDKPEFLEKILTNHPEIEVVQIQFNYLDYDDVAIQSKECLEVCRKYNKPVLVMEPIKGGNLVNLPLKAKNIVDELDESPANLALRFACDFDGIVMVLSGMSDFKQMKENLSFMKNAKRLSDREKEAIREIVSIFRQTNLIPCTACRYCIDGCPRHISIPDLFATYNTKIKYHDWNADYYYFNVHTSAGRRASDCLKCGKCELVCPQHLKIRNLLMDVKKEFEK